MSNTSSKKLTILDIVRKSMPYLFALAVLAFLLTNYVQRARYDAEKEVFESMLIGTKSSANKLSETIRVGSGVAKPFVALFTEGDFVDTEEKQSKVCRAIRDNSSAYCVALYKAGEYAINQDGYKLGVENFPYAGDIEAAVDETFIYLEDDFINNNQAVLAVWPIDCEGTAYDLLVYYDLANFPALMQNMGMESKSFYLLTDNYGNIISTCGVQTGFKPGKNLADVVNNSNETEFVRFQGKLRIHSSGFVKVASKNNMYHISYCPLSIGNLMVLMGTTQTVVEERCDEQLKKNIGLLMQLLTVVGALILVVGIIALLSRMKNRDRTKELVTKADTDLLTGLNNKLATERKIKQYMEEHPNQQCAMILLDIDNFKKINDTMGHAFGDEVLKNLGENIGIVFRATDILGRIGGDEFMIFLKDVHTMDDALKQAEKLVYFFKGFEVGTYVKYSPSSSMGMAMFPREGANFEALYKAADKALYKAKHRGKAQLAFFDESMPPVS